MSSGRRSLAQPPSVAARQRAASHALNTAQQPQPQQSHVQATKPARKPAKLDDDAKVKPSTQRAGRDDVGKGSNEATASSAAAVSSSSSSFEAAAPLSLLQRCTQLPSPVRIPVNTIELTYLHSLLSPSECDELIALGRSYSQSTFVGRVSDEATSSTSFLHELCAASTQPHPPSVTAIRARVSELTGLPLRCIQGPNVVRYEPGQLIRPHFDTSRKLRRKYSLFVYLNDVSLDAGGETEFIQLKVKFRPKQGDAVFWRNHADGCTDWLPEAEHQGLALRSGVKYGLNMFARFEDAVPLE